MSLEKTKEVLQKQVDQQKAPQKEQTQESNKVKAKRKVKIDVFVIACASVISLFIGVIIGKHL